MYKFSTKIRYAYFNTSIQMSITRFTPQIMDNFKLKITDFQICLFEITESAAAVAQLVKFQLSSLNDKENMFWDERVNARPNVVHFYRRPQWRLRIQ